MEGLDAMLIEIEAGIAKARQAKDQLESNISNGAQNTGGYELPEAALEGHLAEVEQLLEVVLEVAQLPETRSRLIEKWAGFEKGGIDKTRFYPEVDYLESKPLDYLVNVIRGVRLVRGQPRSTSETYELAKLESILRKTAVLLRGRKIVPQDEREIRDVMHDYLGALFTEYTKHIQVSGVIRSFRPDGGVRNLQAAVEFKFAETREEISTALGGIFEDVSGYSGSADWTRFYSVVYQTEAFEAEERFRAELRRAGAFTWTPILVTGTGSRRRKPAPTATTRHTNRSSKP